MNKSIKNTNFNDRLQKAIENLLARHGSENEAYRADKKPFAVFDWDNTSIIGDVEEALLYYIITHLAFKMDPEELIEVIKKNVPSDNLDEKFNNLDGEPVNIDLLASDIKEAYDKLYGTAKSLGGDIDLEDLLDTNVYKEFVSKMFYRYKAIRARSDAREDYCWMSFLLTNYTTEELYNLCQDAFAYVKKETPRREIFTSPDIESSAGRVEISIFVGLGDIDEMTKLYKTLESNGIDVYIVSASFIDIVRAFATSRANAYGFDKDKVLGLRLEKDGDGKVIPNLDPAYPPTLKEGKVQTINKFIKNPNNYGPIMVGGDSDGDYAMLTSFDQTDLGLIIDRDIGGKINDLKALALDGDNKYHLQARDVRAKTFIKEKRSKELKNVF